MGKLTTLLTILLLTSCNMAKEKGIEVILTNATDTNIISAKCYTSEKLAILEFDSLAPNKTATGFLSMKENKTDGHYILEIIRANGSKENIDYGYYSNGAAFDDRIEYHIEADSVIVTTSK